jgi:hypothetical protein
LLPFGFTNPQDATFDIDDADMITDIKTYSTKANGDVVYYGLEGLGDFKFDQNMTLLKSLEELVMDYTEEKPNTQERGVSFDLSKCGMLRRVIVRNVRNLRSSISLSSGVLTEVDFTGTPIKGVILPENSFLTKLVLPESITDLRLNGLTALAPEGLKLGGLQHIDTFMFSNCPKLDGLSLLQKIYAAGAPLSNVTLHNVDFITSDIAFITKLARVGAQITGKITFTSDVRVTYEIKRSFIKAWGNIDDVHNRLHIVYEKYAVTNVYISGELYVPTIKDVQLYAEVRPERGNNIVSLTWSIAENPYATIDADTGVLKVHRVGRESDVPKAEAEVKVVAHLSDGTVLNATETVGFYERGLQVGDYVYSDGSYSNKLRKDLTVVGICYYLSEDKTDRRLMSVEQFKDCAGISCVAPFNNIQLTDNPQYSVYIIPGAGQIGREDDAMRYMGLKELPNDLLDVPAGTRMPVGKMDTLYTIKHRNIILQDSGVNMPIPMTNSAATEYTHLMNSLKLYRVGNTVTNGDGTVATYYFPATSICYAYVPSLKGHNEKLDARFGEHSWYNPSVGEALLIVHEYLKGKNGAFAQAIKDGILQLIQFSTNSNGVKVTPEINTSTQRFNYNNPTQQRFLRVEKASASEENTDVVSININYNVWNGWFIQVIPVCQF